MRTEIVPFPVGTQQGVPALKCMFAHDDKWDQVQYDQILLARREGVQMLWIESEVWGLPEQDSFLLRMAASRDLGDYPMVAIRSVAETEWSNLDLSWVLDVTAMFDKPMELELMQVSIDHRAGYVPRVREIVWMDPKRDCVTMKAMEYLSQTFGPHEMSWIYSNDDDVREAAFKAIVRGVTSWGLRELPSSVL